MTTSVDPTRQCPSCGQTLDTDDKPCPQCGKDTTDGTKKPEKEKVTRTKAPKVECPFCGELVSKRSKKCPACRTILPAGFYKVPAGPVGNETNEPKTTVIEQAVQVVGSETDKTPSPSSEVVLEPSAPDVKKPEVSIEDETKAIETIAPVDSVPLNEPAVPVEEQNKTAEPAISVLSVPVKEPDMKVEDQAKTAEAVTIVEPTPVEEPQGTIESAISPPEPIAPVAALPAEEAPQITEDNDKTEQTVAPIDSSHTTESPETKAATEAQDSQSCHVSESVVPEISQAIPACNENPVEIAPPKEQAQLSVEPSKPQSQEQSVISGAEKKPARTTRRRKLKMKIITSVPATLPANDIRTGSVIDTIGQPSDRR